MDSTVSSHHTRDTLALLLKQISHGDRAAFSELYRATSRKLYGIALRILIRESLAEEILQEVYLKIWDRAGDFDSAKASPITWMATITRNRALDEVRKRQIPVEEDDSALESLNDLQLTPNAASEVEEELQRLKDCLGLLEKPRDELVILAYLHGFSRDALANKFQQPVGTIKTWLHRSLKQLKGCLGS